MPRVTKPDDFLPGGGLNPPDDDALKESYPALAGVLGFTGTDREAEPVGGEITVECLNGAYRATLKCHANWRKKSVLIQTLSNLFPALEAAIRDGAVPWERFKSFKQKRDPDKFRPSRS